MKKIILNEKQLSAIMGEGAFAYLGNSSQIPYTQYGTDISTKDTDQNGDMESGPTTDKVAGERISNGRWLWGIGSRGYTNGYSGNVFEDNQALGKNKVVCGKSIKGAHEAARRLEEKPIKTIADKENLRKLKNGIKNAQDGVRDHKKIMKDMGFSNQFQKQGGTKSPNNGMAHTLKY